MRAALEGRRAVVTGGGRGIGAAVARALAASGARVAVAARTEKEVEEVARTLRKEGHEAHAFTCDVTDPGQVRELTASVRRALGGADLLVNNAGAAGSWPLTRTSLEAWNRLIAVNATGTFLCTRAMVPGMVERGWGRVVNVASVAGLEGAPYVTAYTAAKHAVVGFTRAAAAELEGTGVTVNAVCPGYVDTGLTREAVARVVRETGRSEEEALKAILERADQARLIDPSEVADRVAGLCAEGPARSADGDTAGHTDGHPTESGHEGNMETTAAPTGQAIVIDGREPAPGDR